MTDPQPFLARKGNYKGLIAYQKAECVYDITFYFANKYLQKGDRTIDQMVQAARSGKQNIAEGSAASTTSSETEIKLMNVAKASLQELLVDYEDYLRVRGLEQWSLQDERTRAAQNFCTTHNLSNDYMTMIASRKDDAIANVAITLIHQTDVVLRKLIDRLEKDFVEQGGIRERMTAARLGYRQGQKTEIDNLRAENDRLKTRIAWLESQLAQYQALPNSPNSANSPNFPNCPNQSNQSNQSNQPNSPNSPNSPNQPNWSNPPNLPNQPNSPHPISNNH